MPCDYAIKNLSPNILNMELTCGKLITANFHIDCLGTIESSKNQNVCMDVLSCKQITEGTCQLSTHRVDNIIKSKAKTYFGHIGLWV